MKTFLKIVLISISLLLFLASCNSLKHRGYYCCCSDSLNYKPVFGRDFNKALYQAELKFNKQVLSSLVFIKRISGNESYRVVFLSESGLKYFDLEILKEGGTMVHHAADFLDRKSLIRILSNDFRLLFSPEPAACRIQKYCNTDNTYLIRYKTDGKFDYYFTGKESGPVSIDKHGGLFGEISISIDEYQNGIPEIIKFSHGFIKFTIELQRLEYQE